jgi:uncharacterized membrane protein YhhN
MQPKTWGAIYFLILLADLLIILCDIPYARFVTKPLLMILLGCYCWWQAGGLHHPVRNFIFMAIIFSWWGDVFLLFGDFFIPGLISFLLAHILYTSFFIWVKPKPKKSYREWIASLLILAYAGFFVRFLYPHLGELMPAVIAYTTVITIMLLSAVFAFNVNGAQWGRLCVGGATLFVVSDSILATEKFYTSFPGSSLLVMLTYGLAQWMIVDGSVKYLKTVK